MFNRHYTRGGLLRGYPGLDPKPSKALHPIVAAAESPRDQEALKRIESVYQANGITSPLSGKLAQAVLTMEARALNSMRKIRDYSEEEVRRGRVFRYTVRDADDFRTTRLSRWIKDQVPLGGLPLRDLLAVLDRSVALAKKGVFAHDLEGVPEGVPCAVPPWFKRRGYQVHYIDPREELYNVEERHSLSRVV